MPDTRARGLDLSHYQAPAAIPYAPWRATLTFGWWRASIGLTADATGPAHGAGLRAAGYLTGAYHALHEGTKPRAQAQLFHSLQHPDDRLPPALDIERSALPAWWVLDFVDEWERLSTRPLCIYTSAARWHAIMGRGPMAWAAKLPLWIAGYPYDSPDDQPQPMDAASVTRRSTPPLDRSPALPDPWGRWDFWQHTGHGRLAGYDKDVDLDVYNGMEAELWARFGDSQPPVPVEVRVKTKLGLHHATGGRDARQWAAVATVMKYVADLGASVDAPAGVICVGRVVDDGAFAGQGFDANRMASQQPPKDAAAQYVAFLADKIRLNPRIDVWEGPNEQVITSQAVMAWYGAMLHEFARLIQQLGKRAGLGGWAVGTPAFELWPFYTLALQATRDFGAILTRHEYGPPDGFLGLRYRVDQREFTRLGYPAVPLIISECGGDNVPGSGPWKRFYVTIDRYWNELLQPYAIELERDAYVLGATVFTDGGGWVDFDVSGSGLVDRVIAFSGRQPDPPQTGEDELDVAKIKADLQIIGEARARILAELDTPSTPAPWWASWPAGVITPARKLKATGRTVNIYGGDGVTVLTTRVQSGEWDVTERRGALLRVLDQAEPRPDWYVKAAEVEPK